MAAENVLIVKLEEESRPTQSTSAASPRPEPPAPPLPPQPPPAASDPTAFYPEYRELRNRADMGGGMKAEETARLTELEKQLQDLTAVSLPAVAAPRPEPAVKSAGRQELELNPETAKLLKDLWSGKMTPEEFEEATSPKPSVPAGESSSRQAALDADFQGTGLSPEDYAGAVAKQKANAGLNPAAVSVNPPPVAPPPAAATGTGGTPPPNKPPVAPPPPAAVPPAPGGGGAAGKAAATAMPSLAGLGPLAQTVSQFAKAAGPAAIALLAAKVATDVAVSGIETLGESARGIARNDVLPGVERGLISLGGHFEVAGTAIREFRETVGAFTDRARELAGYDSRIAGATANADVRKVNADLRESQRVGREYARLVDAQSRLETKMQDLLGPVKEFVVGRLVTILEAVELHLQAVEFASDVTSEAVKPVGAVLTEIYNVILAFPGVEEIAKRFERSRRKDDEKLSAGPLQDMYDAAEFGIQPGVTKADNNQQNFNRRVQGRL